MNIVNTVTAYDLSALPFIEDRWYRVGSSISTYQFYLDTTDAQGNHLRSPMQVTILATDNLRQFATEDGFYYVASLNVIYLRSASEWTRITDTYADKPAATLYDDDGARTDIVDVIDNNGLLKNGSVVIRDSNRVVKAILSVDNNGDIQIKPYLGGGLKLCDNQSGSMLLKNGQVTYDKIIAPGGSASTPSYTLPIATPTILGGVMPVDKSNDMTQAVGVDDVGRLYTAPGSGGGGSSNAVLYTAQDLTDEQMLQARTNIGAGTSNFSGSYNDLTNKPTISSTYNIVHDQTLTEAAAVSVSLTADMAAYTDFIISLTVPKAGTAANCTYLSTIMEHGSTLTNWRMVATDYSYLRQITISKDNTGGFWCKLFSIPVVAPLPSLDLTPTRAGSMDRMLYFDSDYAPLQIHPGVLFYVDQELPIGSRILIGGR